MTIKLRTCKRCNKLFKSYAKKGNVCYECSKGSYTLAIKKGKKV